jgi:alpha-beta hydrolase superfamily lysophospholipase
MTKASLVHSIRTPRTWFLAAVGTAVFVAAALGACGGSGSGGSQPAPSRARDPQPPFAVGFETVTLVDPSRNTPAWGDVPAVASRTIETLVLYPARGEPGAASVPGAPAQAEGAHPLVVFLHGAGTSGEDYRKAIEPWAAAGYVVVAPTAPLAGVGLAERGAARIADAANHPADVRFALAELPDAIDPRIRAIANFDRVVIVGKSLGASTALAVALDPCCTTEEIRGVVAMAGVQSPLIGAGNALPTLVVHGDADEVVPYTHGRANFDAAPEPKYLLRLLGTSHAPTLALEPAGPTDDAVVATTIDFLDRYLKADNDALDRMSQHGNVTGVAQLESSPIQSSNS